MLPRGNSDVVVHGWFGEDALRFLPDGDVEGFAPRSSLDIPSCNTFPTSTYLNSLFSLPTCHDILKPRVKSLVNKAIDECKLKHNTSWVTQSSFVLPRHPNLLPSPLRNSVSC